MSNPEQNMSVASRKPKRKHGSPLALRTAPTIGKRGAGSAFSFRAASGHRISELGLPGRLLGTLSGLIALTHGLRAYANPTGLSVASGSASATQVGSQLTIQASHNAVLDWPSFNIAAGQTTTFQQPSARSVVWNRIYDQNPSQIQGHLNANGFVVLMNQSGFFFGPNSVINVGGFLATTAPVAPPGVGGGPLWQFNGAPPTASIINYGQIKVANGNALFLVAEKIQNHGVLMAPDGTLGLYAGKEVLVSESPDGRGLSAKVTLPVGSIDNTGRLIADAGTIALHAQVVTKTTSKQLPKSVAPVGI